MQHLDKGIPKRSQTQKGKKRKNLKKSWDEQYNFNRYELQKKTNCMGREVDKEEDAIKIE